MKTYFVVTGVINHKDKILVLKKAPDDYNYPNKWGFCSGFIKEFEAAEDTVIREIREETGLKAKITKKANIFQIADKKLKKIWTVQCFLCTPSSDKVRLCHENTEFRWIEPKELKNYPGVPGLKKDLKVLGLI
ncbi:MAG TPA: NUDIX hydrolase [Candidatus Nanoarchaeia archaeon]|nr:NUDIX hydrolase [Candidatus Nanoarchaeia archaeon]